MKCIHGFVSGDDAMGVVRGNRVSISMRTGWGTKTKIYKMPVVTTLSNPLSLGFMHISQPHKSQFCVRVSQYTAGFRHWLVVWGWVGARSTDSLRPVVGVLEE